VLYLVFDARAAYYLIGGADPTLRASGAQNLLVWEAIQFASSVSKVFDFEGSSVPGIEQAFRAYGARQTLIPQIYKMSRRMSALTGAKTIAEAITGRRVKWFV
jgi:lipid II:glycine glycyltransferase (peptidoglycan interpeptide bridge formation enzyme)